MNQNKREDKWIQRWNFATKLIQYLADPRTPRIWLVFTVGMILICMGFWGPVVPPEWHGSEWYVRLTIILLSFACVVYSFVEISKELKRNTPFDTAGLQYIKGTLSFSEYDHDLYLDLERGPDISKLLHHIEKDVPIVAIWGRPGVGKTSLLAAGLIPTLKDKGIATSHWEAGAEEPISSLLDRLRADGMFNNRRLATMPEKWLRKKKKGVIILDQFEQIDLEASRDLFEFLKAVAEVGKKPNNLSLVLAFQKEYLPSWMEYKQELQPSSIYELALEPFSVEQARNIMMRLYNDANLKFKDEKIKDAMIGAMRHNGGVTGLDIGIGMMLLVQFIRKQAKDVTLEDLKKEGGIADLAFGYLNKRLDYFYNHREEVEKALLLLIEDHKKIASGKTIDQLLKNKEIKLQKSQLERYLEELEAARILFAPPIKGEKAYRLVNDGLIDAVRKLGSDHSKELHASREQFLTWFRFWQGYRRDEALAGFWLSWNVGRRWDQIDLGSVDGARDYLEKSRARLRKLCFKWGVPALAGAVVIMAAIAAGVINNQKWLSEKYLRENGLPIELYSAQKQLSGLSIAADVDHFEWLRSGLKTLSVQSSNLSELKELPKSLEVLRLDGRGIPSLKNFRTMPNLVELEIKGSRFLENLEGIEHFPKLKKLILNGNDYLTNLRGIENSRLEYLELKNNPKLQSLAALGGSGLEHLVLWDNPRLSQLGNIELFQLHTLEIGDGRLHAIARNKIVIRPGHARTMPNLKVLRLTDSRGQTALASLTRFSELEILHFASPDITHLSGIEELSCLKELRLNSRNAVDLSLSRNHPYLEQLWIETDQAVFWQGLSRFPHLNRLTFRKMSRIDLLEILYYAPDLEALDLRGSRITGWNSLASFGELVELDLSETDLPGVALLENLEYLEQLSIENNHLIRLDGLDGMASLRSLYLADNPEMGHFEPLEKLPVLETLALAGNLKLRRLSALGEMKKLNNLDLSGCINVKDINGLANLSRLLCLKLGETGLEELEVHGDSRLEKLVLDNTKIRELESLTAFPNLKELHINGLLITNLGTLTDCVALENVEARAASLNKLGKLATTVRNLSLRGKHDR